MNARRDIQMLAGTIFCCAAVVLFGGARAGADSPVTFVIQELPTPADGTGAIAVDICDLDGVGRKDIICGTGGAPPDPSPSRNYIYWNEGGWSFTVDSTLFGYESGAFGIKVVDAARYGGKTLDGDLAGRPDVLRLHSINYVGPSVLYANFVGRTPSTSWVVDLADAPGANGCQGLAVGDLDGDGDLDVISGHRGDYGPYSSYNDGTGHFTRTRLNDWGAHDDIELADFDGDAGWHRQVNYVLWGVPKPATLSLLALGGVGLLIRRRPRVRSAGGNRPRSGMPSVLILTLVAALTASLLLNSSEARADNFKVSTDNSWLVVAPLGDLAGTSINSVGSEWEAANSGWNTDRDFDLTGWEPLRDHRKGFWGPGVLTPIYTRKIFNIPGVQEATLSGWVDDDVQIYINGALVFDDHNGWATTFGNIDIAAYLAPGDNLIAAKAHDSYGVYESLSITIDGVVPEPATLSLLAISGLGLLIRRKRQQRRPSPRHSD